MSNLEWALLLHVTGVIVFFSGMAVAGVALSAARTRERPSEIVGLLSITRRGVALVVGGAVLLLAFGLWLVDLTAHDFGEPWLASSLVLLVAATILGAVGGQAPKKARLLADRLARGQDTSTAELRCLLDDFPSRLMNFLALLASAAILVLMVWQPGA